MISQKCGNATKSCTFFDFFEHFPILGLMNVFVFGAFFFCGTNYEGVPQ